MASTSTGTSSGWTLFILMSFASTVAAHGQNAFAGLLGVDAITRNAQITTSVCISVSSIREFIVPHYTSNHYVLPAPFGPRLFYLRVSRPTRAAVIPTVHLVRLGLDLHPVWAQNHIQIGVEKCGFGSIAQGPSNEPLSIRS
ncbi:hypothetical protein F4777DRAFT_204054 [Nemania sp. FL0916]|nr:hypothetical protein F4777DRAFT_204054 [Nemania sp. FL0916]